MTKTIFITGATAGIGAAAARLFASRDWRVIGTGRRLERLNGLRAELDEAFEPLALDMRDTDALAATAANVDVLLNNAGLAPPMSVMQEADVPALENAIQTNVTGLVALTRALLPGLIERRGAVINLSSVAATYPYRGGAIYAGTKAFIRHSRSTCAATWPAPGCGSPRSSLEWSRPSSRSSALAATRRRPTRSTPA